jgi:hypothetical protein
MLFLPPHNKVSLTPPQNFLSLSLSIATNYGLDDQGFRVRVPVGSRIFSSLNRPDRLWGVPNLLSNGYRGLFPRGQSGRGVRLTTHLQLVPRSRKCGSIHPLPQAFMAWCLISWAKRQLYLTLYSYLCITGMLLTENRNVIFVVHRYSSVCRVGNWHLISDVNKKTNHVRVYLSSTAVYGPAYDFCKRQSFPHA